MQLKLINRSVLVITPKKALLDWVNALDPKSPIPEINLDDHDQATVYLIGETDSLESGLNWLRKNFKDILAEELENWWTDESDWPPLNWETFVSFCHYNLQTCVYDIGRGAIKYDV